MKLKKHRTKHKLPFMVTFVLLFLSWQIAAAETALQQYIHNGDTSFAWQVLDSTQVADVRAYRLRLVSQTWRDIPWIHELVVMVPQRVKHNEGLLFVSGGTANEQTGEPNYRSWDDQLVQHIGHMAHNCQAVTAVLWQVPRQPLFGGMAEDVLVSYTFHQFQETRDVTWPLLFPMTKSAVRAMDAVSQLARSRQAKRDVNRFVVSGISKRGWTTWLTAASDPRVVAFAPMVIDILNMPVNVPYQRHMFGAYSLEIQDYVNLGLTEAVGSGPGKQLVDMVDPYSYRRGLSLPKLLCFGSNDEYWTADAVKNYVDSIGGHTLVQYTPNAGHSLDHGRDAVPALETFFWQTLHGGHYTKLACEVQQEGAHVHFALKASKAKLLQAELWEAVSPTLDFRKQRFERVVQMMSGKKRFRLSATLPQSGYKAFFVRCVFRHPVQGSYALCSRMYTADSKTLFDKPYQLK